MGPGTVREFREGQLYLILVDPLVEFSTRLADPKNPLSARITEMQVERGIAIPVLKRCMVTERDFIGQTLRYLTLETPLGSVRFDLYWKKDLRVIEEIFDLYAELTTPLEGEPKGIRLEDPSRLEWESWAHGMELVGVQTKTPLVQDLDFSKNMKKDLFTVWTSERDRYFVSPKFKDKLKNRF